MEGSKVPLVHPVFVATIHKVTEIPSTNLPWAQEQEVRTSRILERFWQNQPHPQRYETAEVLWEYKLTIFLTFILLKRGGGKSRRSTG